MNVNAPITLTDEQAAYARDLVAEGGFPDVAAVLAHAFDLLRDEPALDDEVEPHAYPMPVEEFRALLAERMKGPFIGMEEANAQVEAMIAAKRAELGLDG